MDEQDVAEAQIAVLGLGLMGSSLCLALRARGYRGRLAVYARRAETREQALRRGMADTAFENPADAMAGSSLAVVCTPVQHLAGLSRKAMAAAAPGAVVTDVGSTKQALVEALSGLDLPGVFVGSHPMCGSEQTGLEAGTAALYEGATVAVCAGAAGAEAVDRVRRLWAFVGGQPVALDPARHDRLVAASSHLPHLAASMLVQAVGRDGTGEELRKLCASGFRDTTRVAAGSPGMWRGILESNAPAIREELRVYRDILDQWADLLERGAFDELEDLLDRNAALRAALTGDDGHE